MDQKKNITTGEPVNQAPGTSETPTPATDTNAAPTPAASEAVPATINATSTGEPVNQAPTPTASGATTPAPAPTAPENTDKAETQVTTSPDLRSAAVDARRQRVEELKKSLTSGSGSVATAHAPSTSETPVPTSAPALSEAPATATSETPEATSTAPTPEIATSEAPAASTASATIPCNYLAGGYYRGEGKGRYSNPALVDQAEAIGKALAASGVTLTAFNRMVRALKGAEKLPYDAQQGAMKKLLPLALKEKKPLLREVVEHNRAAVKNEFDFVACLDHFRDIAIFLEVNVSKK